MHVQLGDASLLSLASRCRGLEILDVNHAYGLTDVGVQQLANGRTQLRYFNCEGQ